MLTNISAIWILIGCFFRLWETATVSFFQQKYFNVYPDDLKLYSSLVAVGSLVGGILSNIISGFIIDYY